MNFSSQYFIHRKDFIMMTNTKELAPLDIFREMNVRQGLSADTLQELYRLERGAAGEKMVFDYLEEFGQENWQVLTNL